MIHCLILNQWRYRKEEEEEEEGEEEEGEGGGGGWGVYEEQEDKKYMVLKKVWKKWMTKRWSIWS